MALTIVNSGVGAYLSGDAHMKALIMGEPGAGKTRSASFWPKPIFANCERKSMSLLDRNVPVANIGSVKDMDELLLVLRAEGQKPIHERRWETLVVDTFDAYQRTMINERLTKERREKMINDDWNWLGTKTAQLLERISNLPMNVVINLHVKDVTEGEGDDKVVKQKPHLKGDVKDQIAAEFDFVGFMESYWSVEGDNPHSREKVLRRRIQWEQDERHPILKDCSGQLGTYTDVDFTEDDFQRIWAPIFIQNDRLDGLPESTAVSIEVPREEVTTPGAVAPIAGGPVASAEQAAAAATPPPAKKAAPRKAAPKKAQASKPPESGAQEAPANPPSPPAAAPAAPAPSEQPDEQPPVAETAESDTATPVASQEGQPGDTSSEPADENDQAVAAVAEAGALGEVVSDEQQADSSTVPAASASGPVCGDGTDTRIYDGCGKDLSTLGVADRDRAELAFVRWRVRLCDECFPKAKTGALPKRAA